MTYVCPTTCQYADDVGMPGAATPPCPGGYCVHYDPEQQVTCGHREIGHFGTWRCVADADHEAGRHYYVRINEGN